MEQEFFYWMVMVMQEDGHKKDVDHYALHGPNNWMICGIERIFNKSCGLAQLNAPNSINYIFCHKISSGF